MSFIDLFADTLPRQTKERTMDNDPLPGAEPQQPPPAIGHNNPPAAAPAPRRKASSSPAVTPSSMSAKFDKLGLAILNVQRSIYSPPRNKTVTITPLRGAPYEFSYTTLEVVMEMLKEPLLRNDLWLSTLYGETAKGPAIVIRLVHVPSQQWVESVVLTPANEKGAQGIGTATTYLRRYATCALFNIVSDDDTDAAQAISSGGTMLPASAEQAERLAGQQANENFSRLVAAANGANSPEALKRMLQVWDAGLLGFLSLRDDPKREDYWTSLLDLTGSAIYRVFGAEMAHVWGNMLNATTREHLEQLRTAWHAEDFKPIRKRCKDASTEAYERIAQGLWLCAQRIETQPPPTSRTQNQEIAPPSSRAIDPSAVGEGFPLYDDVGSVMGEPIANPQVYVRAYVQLRAECDNLDALAEHNAEGLHWARRDTAAAALLASLLADAEPAAPPPAPPPLPPLEPRDLTVRVIHKPGGAIDLINLRNDVARSLAGLDPREMQGWWAANKAMLDALPAASTALKLKAMAAERAAQFGVSLA